MSWTSGVLLWQSLFQMWLNQLIHTTPKQGFLPKSQSKKFALLRTVKDIDTTHRLFWGWRKAATGSFLTHSGLSLTVYGQRFTCVTEVATRKLSRSFYHEFLITRPSKGSVKSQEVCPGDSDNGIQWAVTLKIFHSTYFLGIIYNMGYLGMFKNFRTIKKHA